MNNDTYILTPAQCKVINKILNDSRFGTPPWHCYNQNVLEALHLRKLVEAVPVVKVRSTEFTGHNVTDWSSK